MPLEIPTSENHHEQPDEVRAALAQINAAVKISHEAGAAARAAMARLAKAIVGQYSSQSLRLRALLLNLYQGGGKTDLSDVMTLDATLRRDFAAVVAGVNCAGCPDSYLSDAFLEAAGPTGVAWFLEEYGIEDERVALSEALSFCKRGAVATTPRSSGEKVFARFLASIFLGGEVDLSTLDAVLDKERRALAKSIFTAFVAGKFGSEQSQLVAEYFGGE